MVLDGTGTIYRGAIRSSGVVYLLVGEGYLARRGPVHPWTAKGFEVSCQGNAK